MENPKKSKKYASDPGTRDVECASPCNGWSSLKGRCLRLSAAYRKAALEHHPDKKGAATADEETKRAIELHFTRIQDAYETLSDPAKRREYDSVDDFDDTLPYECHPADFFKVRASRQILIWKALVLAGGHSLSKACACMHAPARNSWGGRGIWGPQEGLCR